MVSDNNEAGSTHSSISTWSITKPESAVSHTRDDFVNGSIEKLPSNTSREVLEQADSSSLICRSVHTLERNDGEDNIAQDRSREGMLRSWRGVFVLLATCGAQLMDNVFMTGVNISLPVIQKEFDIPGANLQWLISAYTLTFGGFLLLAGALADRYGRKNIFCVGMAWLSVWTIADGFAGSFIQLAIFRALQGLGAAMTVPSGVGIISSYFVIEDRNKALTYFGAAGGAGFCLGLVVGGFLSSSLGWRYLFYFSVILTGTFGILGWFVLPQDSRECQSRPKLDILGTCVSTTGLVLLSFVLSSGGQFEWEQPFIIVLLILSVALLILFTFIENKVQNPIMPLSIWKQPNFPALWLVGFFVYGSYQTLLFYLILISQRIMNLSAGQIALRLLPMSFLGTLAVSSMSPLMDRLSPRPMLFVGLVCLTVAPVPCAVLKEDDLNFWTHVLPASLIVIVGVATAYATVTVVLLASVPFDKKSLCGGMINTGFQIGSGFALALASAIVQATEIEEGHGLLSQYRMGMWCAMGMAGLGLLSGVFGVRTVNIRGATKESLPV